MSNNLKCFYQEMIPNQPSINSTLIAVNEHFENYVTDIDDINSLNSIITSSKSSTITKYTD